MVRRGEMEIKIKILTGLFILLLLCGVSDGHAVYVNTEDGETFIMDVDPRESIGELQDKVVAITPKKRAGMLIEIPAEGKTGMGLDARTLGGFLGHPRNYSVEVTPEEKADIRFIVNTLANKSLISIALVKGELESAGDRIDHLHPLRFLMTIFTDEEMKAGVRNIRGKGWMWNHFIGGVKESLATETRIGNVRAEQIHNFSQIVKINPNLIIPALSQQKWEEFVDLLITHIPRSGDHDRYDT
jgi:hypothetical protein